MNKFEFLNEVMKLLGLSCQEVIDYFNNTQEKSENNHLVWDDVAQVEPGYFWYEDNTFSTERVFNKKIKAIVELVEDGVIYGDLTASELFDIKQRELSWRKARKFIEKFPYPCKENEKIVWYNIEQLKSVFSNYLKVMFAFDCLCKKCRNLGNWSSTEQSDTDAVMLNFLDGSQCSHGKYTSYYVRPVIAMKVS